MLPKEYTPAPPAPSAEKTAPLNVGATAPDAALRTIDGEATSVKALLTQPSTVIVFYRGGWCPYCNTQLASLQKIKAELDRLGARLVAISPDRPEELRRSIGKHRLGYTLVSDSPMEAARAFGVAFTVDAATRERYRGFGIDLETASGERHHQLPVPSVFLLGRDAVVRFRHTNPDYRVRLSTDVLLAAVRKASR